MQMDIYDLLSVAMGHELCQDYVVGVYTVDLTQLGTLHRLVPRRQKGLLI